MKGNWWGLTFALVLRMAMISSNTYCRVLMMTNLSSRSTGMPWGDIMSVPRICVPHSYQCSYGNENRVCPSRLWITLIPCKTVIKLCLSLVSAHQTHAMCETNMIKLCLSLYLQVMLLIDMKLRGWIHVCPHVCPSLLHIRLTIYNKHKHYSPGLENALHTPNLTAYGAWWCAELKSCLSGISTGKEGFYKNGFQKWDA